MGRQAASRASQRRRRTHNSPPDGPARFAGSAPPTIADAIYRHLHKAIVSMELEPGMPISEKGTALAQGVSRTPVREAILRLADERLVEVVPQSGTYVARIPLSALQEAIVVRRALEGATVRTATAKATPGQIMSLRATIERQKETAEAGEEAAFHKADEEFHAGIAAIAGYPGIWNLIRQVKVQVDRYRRLTLPQEGRMRLVVGEHAAVVEAMAEGDAARAVRRMEEHLDMLQFDIAVFRDLSPDFFVHDIELGENEKP
jgi:DNA-binding GntR family transcriptional regulator